MSHDSHTRRTEFLAEWRKQKKAAAAQSIARGWLQSRYFATQLQSYGLLSSELSWKRKTLWNGLGQQQRLNAAVNKKNKLEVKPALTLFALNP